VRTGNRLFEALERLPLVTLAAAVLPQPRPGARFFFGPSKVSTARFQVFFFFFFFFFCPFASKVVALSQPRPRAQTLFGPSKVSKIPEALGLGRLHLRLDLGVHFRLDLRVHPTMVTVLVLY